MTDGVIVQNHYYCAQDSRSDVVELRQRANRCRLDLGLPPGTILQRAGGSDRAPWVVWQQHFSGLDDWYADLDVLAASPEFRAIRELQSAALTDFDRVAYRPLGPGLT